MTHSEFLEGRKETNFVVEG